MLLTNLFTTHQVVGEQRKLLVIMYPTYLGRYTGEYLGKDQFSDFACKKEKIEWWNLRKSEVCYKVLGSRKKE